MLHGGGCLGLDRPQRPRQLRRWDSRFDSNLHGHCPGDEHVGARSLQIRSGGAGGGGGVEEAACACSADIGVLVGPEGLTGQANGVEGLAQAESRQVVADEQAEAGDGAGAHEVRETGAGGG